MLDLKALEKDPEGTKRGLLRRGDIEGLDDVLALNHKRRTLIMSTEALQHQRNEANQKMKGADKAVIDQQRAALKDLSGRIKEHEAELKTIEQDLEQMLLMIPNVPAEGVPDGSSEEDNREVKRVLEPPGFDFEPLDHQTLGENLGMVDVERAAKVSGSRFAYLQGDLCRLNRAITTFFLNFHLDHGDTELWTPYLVGEQAMIGTTQLPKFEEDAFSLTHGERRLFLIPTAEVSITNFHADEILDEAELPKRYVAHTPCFRAEAGSAGRDTRGLIRQHQFDKVEMVRFCTADQAEAELSRMVEHASTLLEKLGLAHRVVELCAGDMGFGAERTFDLEVWLPSQATYREISSCSSFGSFQARRAKIRYRPAGDPGAKKRPKPQPITTLNGSGLAVGRTLVAIMENFQRADGTIDVPAALHPYMGEITRLSPRS